MTYFDTPVHTVTYNPDMSFGSINVVSFGPVSFNGSFTATGGTSGAVTLYFTDSGTSHVRDIMQVSSATLGETGTLTGALTTSFNGDLGNAPGGSTQIPITGSVQDISPSLLIPGNLAMDFTGFLVAASPTGIGATDTPVNPTTSITSIPTPLTTAEVNTGSGNDFVTTPDLIVLGKGLRFRFIRHYNSLDTYSGPCARDGRMLTTCYWRRTWTGA